MQDKEFDQFFKDQLAEAEMTPPAKLWANVDAQLTPTPKKRLPMLWMAAAVAVVAVSAALLFNQQEDSVISGQPEFVTTARKPVVTTAPVIDAPKPKVVPVSGLKTPQDAMSPIVSKQALVSEVSAAPRKKSGKKELLVMQPSAQDGHLVSSRNEESQLQDESILVHEMGPALVTATPKEETMVGIQEIPELDAFSNEYNTLQGRKGISNVGDLVNFVVDKIDKREEKILHFDPNDDDQTSLISINIGIIKLNTKQRAKR